MRPPTTCHKTIEDHLQLYVATHTKCDEHLFQIALDLCCRKLNDRQIREERDIGEVRIIWLLHLQASGNASNVGQGLLHLVVLCCR